jgi:hypothetical protein
MFNVFVLFCGGSIRLLSSLLVCLFHFFPLDFLFGYPMNFVRWTNMTVLLLLIYIQLGCLVCCQTIAIPMSTNCAPLLAYMFLLTLKYHYLAQLAKPDIHQARKFNYWYIYIKCTVWCMSVCLLSTMYSFSFRCIYTKFYTGARMYLGYDVTKICVRRLS